MMFAPLDVYQSALFSAETADHRSSSNCNICDVQLVAIDSRVDHVNRLMTAVEPGSLSVLIEADVDGLEQLSAAIALNPQVRSLYVICHGAPGQLHLGNTPITIDSLEKSSHALQRWGVEEIQIYACNVAADIVAEHVEEKDTASSHQLSFIERLHGLTGAAIAASAQKVGNALKGGTWHLEKRIGHLQTWSALPLFESVTFAYTSTLNDAPLISAIDDTSILEDALAPTLNFTISDTETASGSLIVSATSDNQTLMPNGNISFAGTGTNRTIAFQPASNQSGTATITISVSDGVNTTQETFVVTVDPVDDPPTLSAVSDRTVAEDTGTGAIAFTIGDVDTPIGNLVVTATSSDTSIIPDENITLSGTGTNRTVSVLPAANATGTATITLSVFDGTTTTTQTFDVTVTPENDAPTISAIAPQTTLEDTAVAPIAFTVGDVETAADSLTINATSSNQTLIPNGNITVTGTGANRTLTITPAPNQFGSATVTLTVGDGTDTTTRTFTVNVTADNDAPTITDITNQSTNEDTATALIPFTIGDIDNSPGTLTVTVTSSDQTVVADGDISIVGTGANRSLSIQPVADASGTATLTVTVSDGTASQSDTFDLTVAAVNDLPTVSTIAPQTLDEDADTGAIAFTLADVDDDVATLTVTGASSDTTLIPNGNIVIGGSGANRTVTVTPAADQFGTATLTLSIDDGGGTPKTQTFDVTVNSVNDVPTITAITNQTIDEDADTGAIAFTVGDVESTTLTVTATSSDPSIVPNENIVIGGTGTARTVTVTPGSNQNGVVTISVHVSDGTDTTTETFDVTVNPLNDDPTVTAIADQTIDEDTSTAALSFTVGDVETPALGLSVVAASSDTAIIPTENIVVSGTGANRTVTVTPAENATGSATITLTIGDGTTTVDETFLVTVDPVNDAPTISAISDRTVSEDGGASTVSFAIDDVESAGSLMVSAVSSNQTLIPNGSLVLGGTGGTRTLSLTPDPDQFGTAEITVTVSDGTKTATEIFNVTVNPVNDAPTITDITDATIAEDGTTGDVAFTIGDVDTGLGGLSITAASSDTTLITVGNIVVSGTGQNRTVRVTPAANEYGTATVTLTVSDGTNSTNESFVVTVTEVDDVPTITPVGNVSIQEDGTMVAIAFSIADVETPANLLTVTATSSNPTLVPNGNILLGGSGAARTVTVTPVGNESGTATITLTVTDGNTPVTETFDVAVSAVNDIPTVSAIANQSSVEDVAIADIPFTISDVETAAASLTVTATSSNPVLVPNNAANLVLGGTDGNRTLTINPVANQSGTSTITVTVSDGTATQTETFDVTFTAENDLPTISAIADQTLVEDNASGALAFTVGDAETSTNALVVTAFSSNTTLVPNTNLFLSGSGANRTVTVVPAANASGTGTVTLRVSDGDQFTEQTFTVDVSAENDAPTITAIANRSTNEDTATSPIAFTVGDIESGAAGVTVTATSSDETLIPNGNLVLDGTGAGRTLVVTPAANASGTATLTVSVNDGQLTTSETFDITVNPVNDAPTITAIADTSILEDDVTAAIPFTIGDVETPESLTVTVASSNPALVPTGNIVLGGSGTDRTVNVTPTANATGTATITVTVSDGLKSSSETFAVTVTPDNDAPTISAIENQTTDEDTSTSAINVTVGDIDNAVGGLTITATSSDQMLVPDDNISIAGTGANRAIAITPAGDATGTATITVNVSDGTVTTSETFDLTVNPVDDTPTISTVAAQSTPEDTATNPIQCIVGDIDSDVNGLTVSATSSNTAVIPNENITLGGTGSDRTLTLAPAANQVGSSTITLTVDDGNLTRSSTFTISVTAVNDAPTVSAIADQTVLEDTTSGAIAFTLADVDNPVGSLLVSATSSDTTLLPDENIIISGTGANRSLTVSPALNQFGTSVVTLAISDGTNTTTQSFNLTVDADNDAPVLSAIPDQTTDEDTATAPINVTVSDVESGGAPLILAATSSDQTLIPDGNISVAGIGGDRTLILTPASDQVGTATITVVLDDGTDTVTDTFEITVNPVNDVPTLTVPTDQATNEDTAIADLSILVGDVETDANSLTVTATSSNQTLLPDGAITLGGSSGTRTLSLTPAQDQTGLVTITFTVDDGTDTVTDTVDVTVNPVNDEPVLSAIADQTTTEDTATGAIAFTVADVETDLNTLTLTATSSDQVLLPDSNIVLGGAEGDRTITLTPAANQSGSATVTLTLSDGTATTTETFQLTVESVDDPPTITAIANQTVDEDATTNPIAFTIGDTETPAAALTVSATSSNPALVATSGILFGGSGANRTLTITPIADQEGTTTITVSVNDGTTVTTETFDLTVNPQNDAPTVDVLIPDQNAIAGAPFNFTVNGATFGDVDAGDTLTYSATLADDSALPAWLTFTPGDRSFSGAATPSDVGTIQVKVTATDGAMASVSDMFELNVVTNTTPTLVTPIADQTITAKRFFSLVIPSATFNDSDPGDTLTLSLTQGGGAALPSWLTYNPATRTLSGTPPATTVGSIDLSLTATDLAGEVAVDVFSLGVDAPPEPTTTIVTSPDSDLLVNIVRGTRGDDRINGTEFRDVINGIAGNDRIKGFGTSDKLTGGGGRDVLVGGDGDDILKGGGGKDRLNGGNGNDKLVGGGGSDRFIGGNGEDVFIGGAGSDVFMLFKNKGTDTIRKFQDGKDTFKLRGMTFGQLNFEQQQRNTVISFGQEEIAVLIRVDVEQLTRADF
jgi:hypothetical protein